MCVLLLDKIILYKKSSIVRLLLHSCSSEWSESAKRRPRLTFYKKWSKVLQIKLYKILLIEGCFYRWLFMIFEK